MVSFPPVSPPRPYTPPLLTHTRHMLSPSHSSRFCRAVYLLTYLLTPWCRVLLQKLTGLQLVKKFPTFHGTRRFITALTNVRHLSLSWASPIQSIYPHPTSWRSVPILSTHLRLGLSSGKFNSGLFCLQRRHPAYARFLTRLFYREELLAPRPTPKL